MARTPTLGIVGRPNVGKSTLFNRLLGRRRAIVHDKPGVTRDRIAARVELEDGGALELIDTGGLVPGDDPLGLGEQVFLAIGESDLLLFVVDGRDGLVAADERVWQEVRKAGKPTILVLNKSDVRTAHEQQGELWRLGIDPVILVSAEHGLGMEELWGAIRERLPPPAPTAVEEGVPSIAIVGRPNVGKSSLVNRLLGEERALVSPQAGTTRDPVDGLLERDGRRYRLVDTAGIRRRARLSDEPEEIAVLFARRQMDEAEVVVLVVDAAQGVTSGDLAIAGEAWERGRSVLVAVNKWDLVDEEGRRRLETSWPRLAGLCAEPPRVNLSALSGRHVERLLPHLDRLVERHRLELPTAEVNRLFERATQLHQAPQLQGRPWKLYYATQVASGPPTFMLFANRTLPRHDGYRRYLENRLREEHDLSGVPVRLVIRRRT